MSRDQIGRAPDMILRALNKATEETDKVGAAWVNSNGTVSIRLDPFVVLQSRPELVLTLFPNDGGKK